MLGVDESGVLVALSQGGQGALDVPGVAKAARKVAHAGFVPHDEGGVAPLQERGEQRRPAHQVGRQAVLVQKAGQVPVGVEDVAVLVGAVQGALPQAGQQGERLARREQPGREDGHLPFEHLDQAAGRRAALAEPQDVVGVVQPVVAPVLPQGVLDVLPDQLQKAQQLIPAQAGQVP